MQEKDGVRRGEILRPKEPFLVLATQNPIEQEGTYPLPEAQLDRFLFELLIDYPSFGRRSGSVVEQHSFTPLDRLRQQVMSRARRYLSTCATPSRGYPAAPNWFIDYAVRLVRATHPFQQTAGRPAD